MWKKLTNEINEFGIGVLESFDISMAAVELTAKASEQSLGFPTQISTRVTTFFCFIYLLIAFYLKHRTLFKISHHYYRKLLKLVVLSFPLTYKMFRFYSLFPSN